MPRRKASGLPVESLPLDVFRPQGIDRLYVLGGVADISRSRAEQLLRPLELIEVGERLGAAAAAEAAAMDEIAEARLPAQACDAERVTGEVREPLTGVRPIQQLPTIEQEARPLPVLGEYEVLVILEKVALLDAGADFSHHRAVAHALERLGDPAAAPGLAELLAKPGMTGHVHDSVLVAAAHDAREARNTNAVHTRRESLRELLLARALYLLGDHEDVSQAILESYTGDLRGHLARHAHALLEP